MRKISLKTEFGGPVFDLCLAELDKTVTKVQRLGDLFNNRWP